MMRWQQFWVAPDWMRWQRQDVIGVTFIDAGI
jgi:hypothetical protein